ncbi:hypothetical protein E1B28_006927 [Marasmius oreades]|uniref:Cytochrome P450 n=1 Tax=Marasmius oreades TaxID=181124 RepID=A0A9P7UUE5_9AGAR|nr:uncharacterized protein E1B28_006927 [Marasmius oreades]KAG7093241.1 hypothetical protein E1B28_006927 [Marasmius oreades]
MLVLSRVDLAVTAFSLILFSSLYLIKRRSALNALRGPRASSYLLGHEHDLRTKRVDEVLFQWSKEYGTAYKLPGCFGENVLVISDPRAIHRVLQESLQDYPEAADLRRLIKMIFGRGVLWVKGEDHKRHRRVLSPAFSMDHMRQFLPLFQSHVNYLSEKWDNALQGKSQTIDVIPWLHKMTLDIVGESAFNYHFDALEGKPNELTKALYDIEKLGEDSSPTITLAQAIMRYIPESVSSWQGDHFPMSTEKVIKRYLRLSTERAREVLKEAGLYLDHRTVDNGNDGAPAIGTGREKDILSILVRANWVEDPRKRLSEEEILAQMSTLIQAGHHTTGYTLSWILYELAAHPEDQAKVYEEIKQLRERNPEGFTSSEYDSMNHFTLVIKEALRFRPVVPTLEREASKDDVLPLEFPIFCKDGKRIEAVPIGKGQRIKVDISTYNRLQNIWGEDANSWNPKRFEVIDSSTKTKTQVGLFANLLTFSGGPKGCIG